MGISDDGTYQTSDTPLAAFLYYKKHELLGISFEDGRGFFLFPDTELLQQHIVEYRNSNFHTYYRNYRILLNMLNAEMKSRANGRGNSNNH